MLAAATPIKERDDAGIKAALAQHDSETVSAFLRLRDYARSENLGLSALAHQTRISSGILSMCFNGGYPGDYTAIAGRIQQFFYRVEQKAKYSGLRDFCETRLAQALWTIFEKTRFTRRIHIIQSPEQLGKSRAAREYTERNNAGRTIYIKIGGGTKYGASDFIWQLAAGLDIAASIKLRDKRLRIREALQACDLIIIDEAHLIWEWTDRSIREFFDYLRTDIHDDGERGVCLIATNDDMLSSLDKFRRRSRYNVGQLLGRMRNQIMTIDPAEDILLEDVRALVSRYYSPGANALKKLHAICSQENLGHFGLLDDILNESWTRAKAKKTALSDSIVLAVADEIVSELKAKKQLYE